MSEHQIQAEEAKRTRRELELQLKRKFAEWLLRIPNNPLAAASKVFPNHFPDAFQASKLWAHDDEVLNFQNELLTEFGEEHFHPTKMDMARKLWDMAEERTDSGRYLLEPRDRIEAYKTYGTLRKWMGANGEAHSGGDVKVAQKIEIAFVKPDQETPKVQIIENDTEQKPIERKPNMASKLGIQFKD